MKMNDKVVGCPRASSAESDASCLILEPEITVINLDESGEGTDLFDCKSDDCKSDDCKNDAPEESLLNIRFKDEATYIELNSAIARCVKNTLFYLQKSVLLTEDPKTLTITFNETSKSDDGLFIVDSAPSEAPDITEIIPKYSRCDVAINDKDKIIEENNDEKVATSKTTQNQCFNCDGDHSIRDCTKPRDFAKIKQNRAKFSSNKLSYERYHVDVEQRFGHLVAGELSKDLRTALGLRSKELPIHIYRMRMCGYPPGWLEYAKVSGSGLSMFGSEVVIMAFA